MVGGFVSRDECSGREPGGVTQRVERCSIVGTTEEDVICGSRQAPP